MVNDECDSSSCLKVDVEGTGNPMLLNELEPAEYKRMSNKQECNPTKSFGRSSITHQHILK